MVDHKPLLGLYKPRTKELTARVARHKSKLGGFDFKLVYEPGCTTPSDYGSRHPPPARHYTKQEKEELGIEDAEEEMEFVVNEVEEISEAVTLPVLQHYTRKDKELQELIEQVKLQK